MSTRSWSWDSAWLEIVTEQRKMAAGMYRGQFDLTSDRRWEPDGRRANVAEVARPLSAIVTAKGTEMLSCILHHTTKFELQALDRGVTRDEAQDPVAAR